MGMGLQLENDTYWHYTVLPFEGRAYGGLCPWIP